MAALAVPWHLMLTAWKGALWAVQPSWFMAGNVAFALGLIVAKTMVVVAHRREAGQPDHGAAQATYRRVGAVLIASSALYMAMSVPLMLGSADAVHYDERVAIGIATVTFTELGIAVGGIIASRRRRDLLSEALKLSNLAAALVLVVLTQSALLAATDGGSTGTANGGLGVLVGGAGIAIGIHALRRPLADAGAPTLVHG
ncbi:hypothetical protein [Demequina soli]|uniref:hypothetical protein n=1 Tax=Demequina soli TaxID=1638987 RepID=UPI000784372F|nr:hypothetical protein [Demequina soli]